jgi:hypothetical protein
VPAAWNERFTPTAVGLVSRAWVIEEVERRTTDPATRAAWVDDLIAYQPPRRHGLRNMFLFWLVAIGASMLAGAVDLPRWLGFVVAVAVFAWVARELATRALKWRLDQLAAGTADDAMPSRG